MSFVESHKSTGRYSNALLWNLFAAVATQGSTLVGNVLVARTLDIADFGAFSIIQSTLMTASMVSQLGAGLTASRFVAEFLKSDPDKAMRVAGMLHGFGLVAGMVFAVALLVCADWLAGPVLGNPQLAGELRLGCVYIVAATVSGTQVGTLAGLGEYSSIARSGVIASVVYCAVIALFTLAAGVGGAVAAISLALVCRVAIQTKFLMDRLHERGLKLRFDGFFSERTLLFQYAIPAALSGMSTMPAIWFANASLTRTPDGLREMGLLSAALSYRNLVLFLPTVVDSVGSVRLAQQLGARNHRAFRHAFYVNLALTVLLATGVASVVWLGADIFLGLFGASFSGREELLGLLLLSALLQVTASAAYQMVNMAGVMWLSFFLIALPRDVGFAALAARLVQTDGAYGIAWAYLAAAIFGVVVTTIIAGTILRKNYPLGDQSNATP